ncbi:MAG: IPTL-CTERM sorting domain-containing protein [Thiothrix sp.]|uniref:IPTL-CTERM sorting domain-containing protein n=1 Tax=Thiothrix sp. TaxID=1032 RepID=UPI002633D6AB|nr:IPTL-CTERM sorting domain-containing protein [Thiothrix sp.]MDD5395108.1 IPTL-CTERM sorting domain-containing protein [Thiothrix sp.]
MSKSITRTVSQGLLLLAAMQVGQSAFAATDGVSYKIAWSPTDSRYHVYLLPATTPSKDLSTTAQVTVRVPHVAGAGQFTVNKIYPKTGTNWTQSSTAIAEEADGSCSTDGCQTDDKSVDYLSFTFSPINVAAFGFKADTEVEAFSFTTNAGSCVAGIELMDNANDPFNQLPNSVGTNPGNQFTNLGWVSADDNNYLGNYGGAVTCSDTPPPKPTAAVDSATTTSDTAISIDVLANDTIPSGETATLTVPDTGTGAAQHGTTKVESGKVTYTPTASYVGADSFTYRVTLGNGEYSEATVSLTVDSSDTNTGTTDTDKDGLTDKQEAAIGTDPKLADTDGDGIGDKEEVGSDVLNPRDTDTDGKIDAKDNDDDNDGIPTADEPGDKNNNGVADYLEKASTPEASRVAVPTLSEWAQILLSLLLGAVGLRRYWQAK